MESGETFRLSLRFHADPGEDRKREIRIGAQHFLEASLGLQVVEEEQASGSWTLILAAAAPAGIWLLKQLGSVVIKKIWDRIESDQRNDARPQEEQSVSAITLGRDLPVAFDAMNLARPLRDFQESMGADIVTYTMPLGSGEHGVIRSELRRDGRYQLIFRKMEDEESTRSYLKE